MQKVLSINKAVEEILISRPFVNDAFRLGIVNYSGLARYLDPLLKKKLNKKISFEAVIMAIKRYAEKIKGEALSNQILKEWGKCDLRLKGDIIDLTLKRTPHNYAAALEAHKKIKWDQGDIIYVYQSLTEIAVILDTKNADLILKKIGKDEIINKEEDLAMITLRTPPEIVEMPGVYYYILGLIASQNIGLVDIVSTYTELVLIVKDKDAAKLYDLLFEAIKKARKG